MIISGMYALVSTVYALIFKLILMDGGKTDRWVISEQILFLPSLLALDLGSSIPNIPDRQKLTRSSAVSMVTTWSSLLNLPPFHMLRTAMNVSASKIHTCTSVSWF